MQEYTISYQNLVPESTYLFRVIAYNKYSISYPAESQDEVNIRKSFITKFFVKKGFWSDFLITRNQKKFISLQKDHRPLQMSDNSIWCTYNSLTFAQRNTNMFWSFIKLNKVHKYFVILHWYLSKGIYWTLY